MQMAGRLVCIYFFAVFVARETYCRRHHAPDKKAFWTPHPVACSGSGHDATKSASETSKLFQGIMPKFNEVPSFPRWMHDLCPDVVRHFEKFPYFSDFHAGVGVMTTSSAAHSVCSTYIASNVAAAAGTVAYLHAGSHLGAIVHGGPIPWDDDVDIMLPYAMMDAFIHKCKEGRHLHEDASLHCVVYENAIKMWVETRESRSTPNDANPNAWKWPYVDIFLYKMDDNSLVETRPDGAKTPMSFDELSYFPTKSHYFGGVYLLGPRNNIALGRYNAAKCVVPSENHRLDEIMPPAYQGIEVDCCTLSQGFPFINAAGVISNGFNKLRVRTDVDDENAFARRTWHVPASVRFDWSTRSAVEGAALNKRVPNMTSVEIDNGSSTCSRDRGNRLNVVVFNAERGAKYLHMVDLLTKLDADIVILNEMDIGMARSGQRNTAKKLARALKMNYAWGLEFLELTLGTQEEQKANNGERNFLGLHGNAVLSRCKVIDAKIFRDPIGDYFDDKTNDLNANGFEKRLGGRMALFVKVERHGQAIVVGSTHKMDTHKQDVAEYINGAPAIVGGDQAWEFCDEVGLPHVDTDLYTWPSSCKGTGDAIARQIICSNGAVLQTEKIVLPCSSNGRVNVTFSDHAISHISLLL